jgi:hypothetical protein
VIARSDFYDSNFLTLAVIALTVIGTTFPKSPYFLYKDEKPRKVVFVVAKKFAFALSTTPVKHRVVVLSFDPRDNIDDMKTMEKALGLEKDGNWIFGMSSQKDIRQLMKATGFTVNWDPKTGEYDHPALLIGVDGEGRIVRRLVGFQEVRMLSDVVRELKGEFIPFYSMPHTNVLLRCFEYDPESGDWGFSWGFLFIMLPAVLAFGIVFSIWAYSAYVKNH